jgi:hypothetical protein
LSLKTYICVLVIVTTNLLLKCSFIVHILLLSIGITTYLLFIIFLILNHYGFLFKFNSKASIFTSLSSQLLYLSAILIISFSFIFDYSFKLIDLFMSKSLSSKLILSNTLKQKKRKSSFAIEQTPIINFKQITKKRNSVEISRNFLVNRLPMIMENFNNQIETPKNINFLNQFHPSNKLENK